MVRSHTHPKFVHRFFTASSKRKATLSRRILSNFPKQTEVLNGVAS
jgi:hypothetical protein